MKIICSKQDLISSLNIVSKAVPSRTTMPILECILIDCTRGDIRFIANDMEIGIETIVDGTIKEKGIVALDASIFINIIRSLPDNDVTIDCDGDYNTIISCEKIKLNIVGKNGDDFSYLPRIDKINPVILSQLALKDVIRQTIFSISENEVNKMMSGELFELNGNNLRVASLDGHRISIRNINIKNTYDNKKVIIPGKVLNELSKIISGSDEEDISIYISDKYVVFDFNNTTVVSRLIDGNYYDIDRMISNNYETVINVNKKALIDCINRAGTLIKEGDKRPIIMNINDILIDIKCNSTVGSLNESIEVRKEGSDQIIGFNPKFLNDVLRAIEDEYIDIYLINQKSPCFIRDKENKYIYIVLPVNFATMS